MTGPKILVDDRKFAHRLAASPERGWAAVWWVGVLLTVVSLSDVVLAFYPTRWGTTEWEFGTAASTFASLPLVSIGLAALLGAALARGRRGAVIGVVTLLLVLAVGTLAMLIIFATDIPLALRSVAPGDVKLGLEKAIVKTVFLGVVFPFAYLVAAISGIRQLKAGKRTVPTT